MSKVFVVGDLHLPFHNKRALAKIIKAIKKEKPTHVIQVGDILDQYVFSKFSRSAGVSVDQDIKRGLELAVKFWSDVRKAAPKAKCIQLLGNHDLRISKRISERLPELAEIYNPLEMYQFSGVKTLDSDRDYITIDNVVYCHGWLGQSLAHAKHFNQPVVHGHLHKPCVLTEGKLWSMDVGHCADETSLPLSYTQSKFSKWRMAYGIVEDAQPKLVLL